jgi:hypothetical protein
LGLKGTRSPGRQNADRGNQNPRIFARSKWWEKVSDPAQAVPWKIARQPWEISVDL